MKGYDTWRLGSPETLDYVWTTDKFNYTSDNLDNVTSFDEGLLLAISLGMDEEGLEEYAEILAQELGLE
jgi:hypothetical protein|tara:strand:- start:81 stop:287 length:207 start_codon:yes stop_codon:yes gene_type:complete